MIEYIHEGMQWKEVFAILNKVIDVVNGMQTAMGDSVVEGKIDYNRLINRPSINGVVLSGELDQTDLDLTPDNNLVQRVNEQSERLEELEGHRAKVDEANVTRDARLQRLGEATGSLETGLATLRDTGVQQIVDAKYTTFEQRASLLESRVSAAESSASESGRAVKESLDTIDSRIAEYKTSEELVRTAATLAERMTNAESAIGNLNSAADADRSVRNKEVTNISTLKEWQEAIGKAEDLRTFMTQTASAISLLKTPHTTKEGTICFGETQVCVPVTIPTVPEPVTEK